MRRWYVPITVLGLGSIGALLMTERGRSVLHKLAQRFWQAPEKLLDWEGSLDSELDRIQDALDCIADSIQPRPELGH